MTSSTALSLLLLEHSDRPEVALESLRSGEVDPKLALARTPDLLTRAIAVMPANDTLQSAQLELVQRLAQHGFDPWQKVEAKFDAFDYALQLKHPGLITWLANRADAPMNLSQRTDITGKFTSPLFGASFEATKAMLDIGFDPNALTEFGSTLLHAAREPELVRLLLEKGVDPTIKSKGGYEALDTWDKADIPLDKRRALEKALSLGYQRAPEEVIRTFGRQMIEVGISRTRDRLSDAGLDPKKAQHAGFSLPELLIAQIFNDGFQYDGYFGDPGEQKKLRRLVLAALKMKSPADQERDEDTQRLRSLVLAFTLINGAITASNPKEVEANSAAVIAKPDTTTEELWGYIRKMGEEPASEITRAMQGIEALREAGLIQNPSWVHGWFMVGSRSYIPSVDGWMEPCEDGTPLFFKMGQLSMRGLWDETWREKDRQLQNRVEKQGGFSVPTYFYTQATKVQGGVGALLCMETPNRNKLGTERLLEILNEEGDGGTISLKDPLVRVGLEKWRNSASDQHIIDLLERIDLLAKHNDLQADTPTVSKTSVRRM